MRAYVASFAVCREWRVRLQELSQFARPDSILGRTQVKVLCRIKRPTALRFAFSRLANRLKAELRAISSCDSTGNRGPRFTLRPKRPFPARLSGENDPALHCEGPAIAQRLPFSSNTLRLGEIW